MTTSTYIALAFIFVTIIDVIAYVRSRKATEFLRKEIKDLKKASLEDRKYVYSHITAFNDKFTFLMKNTNRFIKRRWMREFIALRKADFDLLMQEGDYEDVKQIGEQLVKDSEVKAGEVFREATRKEKRASEEEVLQKQKDAPEESIPDGLAGGDSMAMVEVAKDNSVPAVPPRAAVAYGSGGGSTAAPNDSPEGNATAQQDEEDSIMKARLRQQSME